MADLQEPQKDNLISNLVRAINYAGRSLYNVGLIQAKRFSTKRNFKSKRVEINDEGIFGYGQFGVARFSFYSDALSNDGFNLDAPFTLTENSLELSSSYAIASDETSIKFFDDGTNNRYLGFYIDSTLVGSIGIVGGGANQWEILKPLKITGESISLSSSKGIKSTTTEHNLYDDGSNNKYHNFKANGADALNIGKVSGGTSIIDAKIPLQINNTPINITTETLTKYVIIKDSGGNDIKVGIVT